MPKFGVKGEDTAVAATSMPEGLRMACVHSGMRFRGKVVAHHPCDTLKVCKTRRTIYGSCRYHNTKSFSSDPTYVAEFISALERKNGKEAQA